MINRKELFLLNMVLDKRDFYGLPSLQGINLSPLLGEQVYKSLIQKGLLADKDHFTISGAKLIKCMSDYQNAKRFVRLGSLTLGILQGGFAIGLVLDPLLGLCDFVRVKVENIEDSLEIIFPFLKQRLRKKLLPDMEMTYSEFNLKFSLGLDSAIYLSSLDIAAASEDLEKAIRNEVMFYDDGRYFHYDVNRGILHNCVREEIYFIINRRLVYV